MKGFQRAGSDAAYLIVQTLHARYSLCLLERIAFYSMPVRYVRELFVDIVQDLAVHLQRLDDLLVRVLQGKPSKIRATSPHPAAALPRCGVPRKMIIFVRGRQTSDRRMACNQL